MKRILLRLPVFFLVTIYAKEFSNAEASDKNRDSLRKWKTQGTYNDAGHDSQPPPQYHLQKGDGDNGRTQNLPTFQPQPPQYGDVYQQGGTGNNWNNNPSLPLQVQDSNRKKVPVGFTNTPPTSPLALAAMSEGKLATKFMAAIGEELRNVNFVINAFGIWSITAMIHGTAGGETAKELSNLLGESNKSYIENAYRAAYNAITKNSNEVESNIFNFVARPAQKKLRSEFSYSLNHTYKAEELIVNTFDEPGASSVINDWAARVTKNRITCISTPGDLFQMTLVLGTASFFKGKWKYPFKETATFSDDFKNENDVIINKVRMMRSREMYKNGYSSELESQVIELPYGDGEISMVVFLPRRKVTLLSVLNRMKNSSFAELLPLEMSEEEVDLSFPSFTTSIDLLLNRAFVYLNAKSMFGSTAVLPGLSEQNYISRIYHKVEIETSEEGTTASAITSAQVAYKVSSASFHANRPFIYFINHIPTRLVLFSGQFVRP